LVLLLKHIWLEAEAVKFARSNESAKRFAAIPYPRMVALILRYSYRALSCLG
jgi:hypothetical protein